MPTDLAPRVLIAKTGLDGHWRGVSVVGRALRDAGFEVVLLGMSRADEIVSAAVEEDVDLIGLNVGGRIEVVDRILDSVRERIPDVPVFAGGTISPSSVQRLAERNVPAFPPGSSLSSIVAMAKELTS
jgi:methylmalonyl-CoA mutase, C-terminal domain